MDGGTPMLLWPREEADEVRLGSSKLPAASASPDNVPVRHNGERPARLQAPTAALRSKAGAR
jgi:hypothetical protein